MEPSDNPTLTDLPTDDNDGPPAEEPPRRSFLVGFAAVVTGAIAGIVPAVIAMMPIVDPLRRKSDEATFVPVTSIGALPDNGMPRQVTVYKDIKDAWNTVPHARVGAVYLHKKKDGSIVAFNAVCPHAGCFVAAADDGSYVCPCHDSEFEADGAIRPLNARGKETKSLRALDTLETKIDADGLIHVQFQNFRSSIPEKKAL